MWEYQGKKGRFVNVTLLLHRIWKNMLYDYTSINKDGAVVFNSVFQLICLSVNKVFQRVKVYFHKH